MLVLNFSLVERMAVECSVRTYWHNLRGRAQYFCIHRCLCNAWSSCCGKWVL